VEPSPYAVRLVNARRSAREKRRDNADTACPAPAEGGDAPAKRLWTAEAKVWMKRRQLEPAKRLMPVCGQTGGRLKRGMPSFGHIVSGYVVSARYEGHGVGHPS
jgi:hypothetical protein